MKPCPECNRNVPDMAERCECGYSFAPAPPKVEHPQAVKPAEVRGEAAEAPKPTEPSVAQESSKEEPMEIPPEEELPEEEEYEEEAEERERESFEDIPEGPMEEISFEEAEKPAFVAEKETGSFRLFRPLFLAALGANLAVLAVIVYLVYEHYLQNNVAKSKPQVQTRRIPAHAFITRAMTPEREVEEAILTADLKCQIKEITRTTPPPADVRVTLQKESAWSLGDLRDIVEADAVSIIKNVFSNFPDVQQVTVRVESRLEGDINPEWAQAFKVVVLRTEHEKARHLQGKPAEYLSVFRPEYHPKLMQ